MNKLVLSLLFLGIAFSAFSQNSDNDEIRLFKKSDPKCYSVPESKPVVQESVTASYNTNNLFISIADFTGAVTVEVLDANNMVVINDTRKVSKQAVLTYSIGKLKPGVYTLVVKASGEYYGEFYKKALDNVVLSRESLILSSLSYQ
ncbi:MAG TPA: DUF3244 domain-containing protein [Bacteroidales bacterium]|jgi:hypothetical protein|nr:DUF3244 domain-containing protein [Bacteroidales bacterium]HOQ58723.1 DUF3244 domain-containing protein [Bacteroidales bacterium]